jgi:hypothetical protein
MLGGRGWVDYDGGSMLRGRVRGIVELEVCLGIGERISVEKVHGGRGRGGLLC